MTADAKWLDVIIEQGIYHDLDRHREDLMGAAMLTGDEFTLFGSRCRVKLEWIDAPPWGCTEEQLRAMGERMKASALRQSEAASERLREHTRR